MLLLGPSIRNDHAGGTNHSRVLDNKYQSLEIMKLRPIKYVFVSVRGEFSVLVFSLN